MTLRHGARSVAPSARLLPPIGRKNGICTDLHDSGRPVWRFYQRAGGLWHRSVRAWLVAAGVATTRGGGHRGGLFGAGQPAGSVEGAHAYQPGLSGALPSMWIALRPWSKGEQRAALQPFNMVILGIVAVLLWQDGVFDAAVTKAFLIVFPASLVGSLFGLWCFGKIPEGMYSRILIGLMFVSGTILLVHTFFGKV